MSSLFFFQYEAALAVDAIDVITRALNHMMKEKPDIFKSTIRRTKMYNQNKTQGIPCTYPQLWWEHGDAIIEQIKMVRSFDAALLSKNVILTRFIHGITTYEANC